MITIEIPHRGTGLAVYYELESWLLEQDTAWQFITRGGDWGYQDRAMNCLWYRPESDHHYYSLVVEDARVATYIRLKWC